MVIGTVGGGADPGKTGKGWATRRNSEITAQNVRKQVGDSKVEEAATCERQHVCFTALRIDAAVRLLLAINIAIFLHQFDEFRNRCLEFVHLLAAQHAASMIVGSDAEGRNDDLVDIGRKGFFGDEAVRRLHRLIDLSRQEMMIKLLRWLERRLITEQDAQELEFAGYVGP